MASQNKTRTTGVEMPVRLTLPPEQHDRLRLLAAAARLPMSQYVRQLVLAKISEKKS